MTVSWALHLSLLHASCPLIWAYSRCWGQTIAGALGVQRGACEDREEFLVYLWMRAWDP